MGFPRSVQINPWLHLRFSASCSRTWRSDGPGPISKPGRYKQPETRRNIGHQPVPSFFSFQFRFEKKITCLFQPSIQPSYHHSIICPSNQPFHPSIHISGHPTPCGSWRPHPPDPCTGPRSRTPGRGTWGNFGQKWPKRVGKQPKSTEFLAV